MHMGDEELKSYDALMQANYAAYEAVDATPDYVPAVKYPRVVSSALYYLTTRKSGNGVPTTIGFNSSSRPM